MKIKKIISILILFLFCSLIIFSINIISSGNLLEYSGNDYFCTDGLDSRALHDQTQPCAIYKSDNDTTWVVYQANPDNAYIQAYNHITNTWSSRVLVGTNPLSSDSHGCPSVLIDNNGYFHIFFGSHNSPIEYRRSTNIWDISTWTTMSDIGSDESYPMPFVNSSTIYLVTRDISGANSEWYYRTSTDNGSSWNSRVLFASCPKVPDSTCFYPRTTCKVEPPNSIINTYHIAFGSSIEERDVFFWYLDLADMHVKNSTGYDMGADMSYAEAESYAKLVDTGDYVGYGERYRTPIYGYNDYYILYPTTEDGGNAWLYCLHTSDGITWNNYNTTIELEYTYGWGGTTGIALYSNSINGGIIGDGDIFATVPRGSVATSDAYGGARMERWESTNYGQSWSLTDYILNISDTGDASYNNPNVPVNFDIEFIVAFSEDSDDYATSTYTANLYAWGTNSSSNISFNSINNQGNNSIVYTGRRYFNWTKVDGATKYQLQISNSSTFSTTFINFSNITEGCDFESMAGGNYTEKGNYVEFYLPYRYNISWYDSHYYRVRAYTTG